MKIKMKYQPTEKIKKLLDVIQETIELKHPIGGIVYIPDYKFIEKRLDLYDVNSILLGFLREGRIKNYEHFYGWMTPSGGINISSKVAPLSENDYGIYEIKIDEKKISHFAQSPIPEIYYNCQSGIGFVDGKRFKFKDDQPEFKVFSELYKNINKPLFREKVLRLSNFYKEDEGSDISNIILIGKQKRKKSQYTSATYFINALAKKIRERTGLNINQLVNNNGNLTLVGKRLKNPPK